MAFEAAKKELGVPYDWGGTSPQTGFDCSGLMQWAYHQVGVDLPRVAAEQATAGTPVSLNDLRQGDLVFFRIGGGEIDHVGMYVGNHEFIEAPRTGENVQYANLNDPYWAKQFAGARRIVPLDATSGAPAGAAAQDAAPPATTTPPATTAPPATTPPPASAPTAGAPGTADAATTGSGSPGAPAAGPGSVVPAPTGAPSVDAAAPAGAGSASASPQTAAFSAAPSSGGPHRVTVQFLQAVRPAESASAPVAGAGAPVANPAAVVPDAQGQAQSPGSGIAGQSVAGGPAPAEPAAQVIGGPGQPTPAAEQVTPVAGQVTPAAGQVTPAADQMAGQGLGVASAGDVLSVSSPVLASGQETFAAHLASLTGLSPRVIAAWALAEESGGAAQARQGASNFNWLNIGYFDSGAGKMAFDHAFSDPVTAAEQTARFLKGDWGGASASIRAILNSVGKPPEEQIAAIANSDWASSHYYGGSSLRGTYAELGDMQIVHG